MKPARNIGKQKKIAAENNGEPLRGTHGSKSKEKRKLDSSPKTAVQRQHTKDSGPRTAVQVSYSLRKILVFIFYYTAFMNTIVNCR